MSSILTDSTKDGVAKLPLNTFRKGRSFPTSFCSLTYCLIKNYFMKSKTIVMVMFAIAFAVVGLQYLIMKDVTFTVNARIVFSLNYSAVNL